SDVCSSDLFNLLFSLLKTGIQIHALVVLVEVVLLYVIAQVVQHFFSFAAIRPAQCLVLSHRNLAGNAVNQEDGRAERSKSGRLSHRCSQLIHLKADYSNGWK